MAAPAHGRREVGLSPLTGGDHRISRSSERYPRSNPEAAGGWCASAGHEQNHQPPARPCREEREVLAHARERPGRTGLACQLALASLEQLGHLSGDTRRGQPPARGDERRGGERADGDGPRRRRPSPRPVPPGPRRQQWRALLGGADDAAAGARR